MYHRIDFTVDDGVCMRQLVVTLLERPELAANFKALCIRPCKNHGSLFAKVEDTEQGKNVEEPVLRHKTAMASLLKTVSSRWNIQQDWLIRWPQAVFLNNAPMIEACVAFFLTVATNIEHVDFQLDMGYESWLDHILVHTTSERKCSELGYALQQLENLVLRGKLVDGLILHWVPLPANVSSISITDYHIDHLEYP